MRAATMNGIRSSRWRKRFSSRVIPIAFYLSTVGIAGIGFLAFYVLGRTTESEEWVMQTSMSVARLERLHQMLLAAESSGRAFLVTGDGFFSESYDRSLAALDNELRDFRELTAANAAQQASAARLSQLIDQRFADLAAYMAARASKGLEGMRGVTLASGVAEMQSTLSILDQMKETENRLLAERVAIRKRQNSLLEAVLAAFIAAAIVAMAVLFWLMNRLWKQRQGAEARAMHLAHHDILTGLPNRRLLEDRMAVSLARAKRYKEQFGILGLDLDGFKEVNDTHGHEAGDELLQLVAGRLLAVVRAEDTVARLGGDEFVVAFTHVAGVDYAKLVADRIIHQVSMPCVIKGHEVGISTSIGIAVYPANGATQDDLLSEADKALYEAKRAGKNRYALATAQNDPQS